MIEYLSCMKRVKGVNEPDCRNLAKSYLTCRMDKYVPCSSMKDRRLRLHEELLADNAM